MRAVGNQRLAFMQRQRLVRPENAIAHPIRNIHGAIRVQTNDMRLRHIEICIMRGNHGVVKDSVLELLRALHPARNHRVGIQRPPVQRATSGNF